MPFSLALLLLFGSFVLVNLSFGILDWQLSILDYIGPEGELVRRSPSEYIYFGFVTGLTIGYGDYHPFNDIGRQIVIVHGLSSALVFSLVTALIVAKALSPRNVIMFSNQLVFDNEINRFYFRIINTHRSRLLNLQVRIAASEHAFGNVIAGICPITSFPPPPWLGSHDYTVGFEGRDPECGFDVAHQMNEAIAHDSAPETRNSLRPPSRFKVDVLILGTYRTQSYAQEMTYRACDIVEGVSFTAIQYNDEDKRRFLPIRYRFFPEFWSQFNRVVR